MRRRSPRTGHSLVLPAAVMTVLTGAFLVWLLIDAPPSKPVERASPNIPIRAPSFAPAVTAEVVPVAPRPATVATPLPVAPAPVAPEPPPVETPAVEAAVEEPAAPAPAPTPLPPPLALQPGLQQAAAPIGAPLQLGLANSAPAAPAPPPVAPRPLQTARAPVQPQPLDSPAPPPIANDEPPAAAVAAGTFAAILASTESEADARAQLVPLQKRFVGVLGGKRLSYHREKVAGGAFQWRIRTTGLSEADAEALCSRVSAAGGECSTSPQ